jgi:L-amino acid N-acyltransferase YncA
LQDIGNGENEMKRLHQTALLDANNFRAREERKQRKAEGFKAANDARHRQIAMAVDEPNPFSPKVEMYVRPAQRKDAQDIRKIYNHYVVNSIIPEDQQPISLEDAELLVETAQREKLPFVVAVKGRVPPTHDAQGRNRAAKIILPQAETVLGFAFAERFNYAFSGNTKGRSRGTVTIQLYVDSTSTRKGVGRNALDQLLHCMATAYTFKNACPWINPENDPVHEPNGCGLIHQMLMMVPVLKKEDPDFPWLSKFLYNKFWFKEENRLKSVARSSILHGTGRMLDIAILQCELLHEGEFDAFS